jgi:hypothetical protein
MTIVRFGYVAMNVHLQQCSLPQTMTFAPTGPVFSSANSSAPAFIVEKAGGMVSDKEEKDDAGAGETR